MSSRFTPMKQVAALRSFLIVWMGQLVSSVGSRLSTFALGLWVLRTTGSTTQFAMIYMAMAIPSIFASSLAGPLVDRWNRRRIMLACDALAALTMLSLAVSLASGHMVIGYIYVAVGINAVLDSFRSPAFMASIPLLVAQEQLPRANALVQTGEATAAIVGPLLAGMLVSWISFRGVLIIDASTFLVGVLTLTMIAIPNVAINVHEAGNNILREAVIGWRYVRQRAGLLGLLEVYGFNHFIFAVVSVLIAPLLLSFTTPAMVGVQYAVGGAGLLAGGAAMTMLGGHKKRITGVLLYTALGGLCIVATGLRPSFTLIAVAGFLLFTMMPVVDASNTSLWQSKVPSELQGRCFASQQLLLNLAMALGFSIAGPLADHVFEPMLTSHGALADSVGRIIGVGTGRGLGLMFVLFGLAMTLNAIKGYFVPAVRHIDDLENVTLPTPEAMTEESTDAVYKTSLISHDVHPEITA
jgi:MFS transporter, DHA3 family, macrolide efflux protein